MCGAAGYPCCAGNSCQGGGCCVSDICMAPGGTCVGLGGGTCNAGACGACGGLGLPCCGADGGSGSGSCTAPNTRCSAGICAPCGEAGSACCAGAGGKGQCNGAHAFCDNASNLCKVCGTPGNPCCPGTSACDAPGCCYGGMCVAESGACGASAGTCQAGRCSGCGSATQPCCTVTSSSNTCYDGLLCKSSVCTPCGDLTQACCPSSSASGQCQAGLACSSSGADGVCGRCGSLGDVCCANRACNDGCCSAEGRCVVCAAPQDGGAPADAPVDACSKPGALPCTALPRFTGTQVLDGKDDEFCSLPSFELAFASPAKIIEHNGTGKSYAERAVTKIGWDAAGLHAFIRVHDTTFTAANPGELWNGDGVELMFSSSTAVTGLTSADKNTLHVIVSPPVAKYSLDYGSTGDHFPLPEGQAVSGSDATGYWVELNLPWPGTVPSAGGQIKLDMQLNAADGKGGAGESYVRDAQAILYLGSATSSSCSSASPQPFCDNRLWCTTTLEP
jgi:hypothetical protein